MCTARLDQLKDIRKALMVNQQKMAEMLGVSVRAVQSYEQGWRKLPPNVLRFAWLLLYCDYRSRHAVKPCWEIKNCPAHARTDCFAFTHRAGDLCWLMNTRTCNRFSDENCSQRITRCSQCPVLLQLVPQEEEATETAASSPDRSSPLRPPRFASPLRLRSL